MKHSFSKYPIIIVLLFIFLNRGLFVAMPETEINLGEKSSKQEINSFIELLAGLITGENNNIDEDGDSSESLNTVKITQTFIYQTFSLSLETREKFAETKPKLQFPDSEKIPQLLVYGQIDHPPQLS